MDLYGCHFEYAGKSSRLYDLVFVTVDSSKYLSLAGKTESVSFFNKKNKKNYHLGDSYDSSVMSFEAEIVSNRPIDRKNQRSIEKWLFYQPDYCKLYIDMNDDPYGECYNIVNGEPKRLYLNCRFVNPEKIERSEGVAGYRFTIECDSSMAWQDAVVYEYILDHNSAESNSLISVDVNTDLNDYIYPKVTITVGNTGGNISISNNSDDETRMTSFVDLTPNTTVIMNGDGINYISGDNYIKFLNKNFVRLLDGENRISVLGDVVGLVFEFQNRYYI